MEQFLDSHNARVVASIATCAAVSIFMSIYSGTIAEKLLCKIEKKRRSLTYELKSKCNVIAPLGYEAQNRESGTPTVSKLSNVGHP